MNAPATTDSKHLSRKDKALATIEQRGELLFCDCPEGRYRIEPYAARPGVFAVYQPEGKELEKGQALWYDVDVINQICDCAACEHYGTCKHLQGTNKAVAGALRLVSPLPVTKQVAAEAASVTPGVTGLNEHGALPGWDTAPSALTSLPQVPAWTTDANGRRSDAAMWE